VSQGYQVILDNQLRDIRGGNLLSYQIQKPFALVAYSEQEGAVLSWLENTFSALQEMYRPMAFQMIKNVDFYNAIQHLNEVGMDTYAVLDRRGEYLDEQDLFVMNHARDFVNQKVAGITRYKPNLNVLPWNNSYRDRLGAKFSKRTIDTIYQHNDAAQVARDVAFHAATCGEGYAFVKFDTTVGELSQEQIQIDQVGIQTGIIDPTEGMIPYTGPNGEQTFLDKRMRIGDVALEALYPWMVLKEPAMSWKDVNYIFIIRIKHIDQVRMENPNVDIDERAGRVDGPWYNTYHTWMDWGEYVCEVEFFHRRVEYLDAGFYAKFIPGVLLESGALPNSNGKLPVARFTDYDDLKTPHGRSFLQDIRPPLVLHNKMMNLMYRNIAIAGHPKLMVPRGTVNINSMAGGPFVVEYEPPYEPKIMTFNAISNELFKLPEVMMGQIQQIAGVFGLSRGDVVPNARAASILNMYEEQEEQRNGVLTDKWIAFQEKMGRLVLDCAADNYKPDDARSVKIFGRNNSYKLRELMDIDGLKGPSDVRIDRTTSLAETKQGRIDQIVQLSNMPLANPSGQPQPGLFTPEQVLRMIDLADSETFFDMATAAVDAAESENEDMYESIPVDLPQEYQSHIIHWMQHYQFIQSKEFSDTANVPEEVRRAFVDHIMVHEMFMYQQAKKSLAFAVELNKCVYFPAFLKIGPEAGLPEMQLTIAQIMMIHQTPPMPPEAGPAPTQAPAPQESQQTAEEEQ